MKTLVFLLLVVLLISFSCTTEIVSPVPPDLDRQTLLAVPETLQVEQYQMTLSTYMWRDFQPVSSPNGRSLIAIVRATAINVDAITTNLDADAIWLIYNDEIWKSWFTEETGAPSEQQPNRIVRIARNGPKWGPDVFVEVVVRILDSRRNPHFLRASNQFIDQTW